jgi:hypothetical protein
LPEREEFLFAMIIPFDSGDVVLAEKFLPNIDIW